MVREYWKTGNTKEYFVYLSCVQENIQLIEQLWSNMTIEYIKDNKKIGHHFVVNSKQLNKLPLQTFTKI